MAAHGTRRFQRPQQHDRGGNRQREAQDKATPQVPVPEIGECDAKPGAGEGLHQRTWDGDGPYRQQILERDMQADAEHQQDHADFGELSGDCTVHDDARGKWPDRDAGQQITHQGRQAQSGGEEPASERINKPGRNGFNQGIIMGHNDGLYLKVVSAH